MNIGLNQKECSQTAHTLNLILANEYVLYTKVLNFHWNIEGSQFHDLHKFLEHLYEQLLQINDDVAERIRSLGFYAFGTLSEFSKNSTLKEEPGIHPAALSMLEKLLSDHETIINQIRSAIAEIQKINDEGTVNFLIDLLEKQEKTAWMLRAHLVKK